ncbi:MAG: GMC family oxidoreductase [Desulfobacterales bacterium]|nr:MAG: GMC family oxidoreductase [Desulfobacterales bacterium]
MAIEKVDICIIGSGFGGSISAARLSQESDGRIVVLEKGKRWQGDDFQQSQDTKYLFELYEDIQGDGIFVGLGKGVGGGSLIYSSLCFRAPSDVFEQRSRRGRRIWPQGYTRENLDPYYDKVESVLGVVQLGWTDEELPSWQLVSKKDGIFAKGCDLLGRTCDPARVSVKDCRNCGWCSTGCKFDRKQSLILNYIPMAEENGVEFRAECEAWVIQPARGKYRVIYWDLSAGAWKRLKAKIVIVAAGAIHSPALLLRSKKYLPLLSSQVGRNLSGNGDIALGGLVPDIPFEAYKGKIMGTISYGWWDEGIVLEAAFALPIGPTAKYATHLEGACPPYYWGLDHKHMKKDYSNHILFITGLGLDGNDGRVRIHWAGRPKVSWQTGAKSRSIYDAQIRAVGQIIEALGGSMMVTHYMKTGEVITAHPLGTCRMAANVFRGVVDENCRVFNYPNLYVVDGSVIPTSLGVNPALTIAAIAEKVSVSISANL